LLKLTERKGTKRKYVGGGGGGWGVGGAVLGEGYKEALGGGG